MNETAVLLLAFGGADSPEAIAPFLKNIMRGRPPAPEIIETITERYNHIGGKSPIMNITLMQAEALQKQLENQVKTSIKVFVGMRFWHPFIKNTISEMTKEGVKKIIAICMTPQKSNYSTSAYENDVYKSLKNLDRKPEVTFVSEWHTNSLFLEAVAEKINEAMVPFKENRGKTVVIFSAHSLPLGVMGDDDPYVKQVMETIQGILSLTEKLDWKLGYQSKGFTQGKWLEPTVDSIIDDLPEEGYKNVLLVPIVFVSDHVETLYDIDIVYRQQVESLGLNFSRSKSLNNSPKFIKALSDVVLEILGNAN